MSYELFNVASRHRLIAPVNDGYLGRLFDRSQSTLPYRVGEFGKHLSQVHKCLFSGKMFGSCSRLGHSATRAVWAFKGQLLKGRGMVRSTHLIILAGARMGVSGERGITPLTATLALPCDSLILRQRGNTGTGVGENGKWDRKVTFSWEDVRAFVRFFSCLVF